MKSFQPQAFGKYFLVDRISAGGMGEIFRAKTFGINGFEKQLAIKRMLPQLSENEDFANILIDEAKLSVQLTHTNIVQVYDLGKIEDEYFISMEYVNGVDLRHILLAYEKKRQTISEEIALYILSEVCRGLEYAHSKKSKTGKLLGIIHRDISPPNILISFEGEVKIADFGIAKVEENTHHTRTGILKGKIPYMSPEQARGEKLDHRTDIFASGLMFFEMLTGHRLFTEEDYIQLLLKIRDTAITEKMLPDSISSELKQILLKALMHDRNKRYSHAGKFLMDLLHYLHTKYPDFTPHTLNDWIQELFSETIQAKINLEKTEASPDSGTYNALLHAQQQEYLVHREDSKNLSNPLLPLPLSSDHPKSGFHFSKHFFDYLLAALLVIAGASFVFYKFYLSKSSPKAPLDETFLTASSNSKLSSLPSLGSLQVSTSPPGAKIFINGRDSTRTSPYVFHDLKVGETYNLTLKLLNYPDILRPVQLKDQKLMYISENFSPLSTTPALEKSDSLIKKPTRSSKKQILADSSKTATEKVEDSKIEEKNKNGDTAVVKGFKKAGSAIKNFFGGGSKENQDTSSQNKTP